MSTDKKPITDLPKPDLDDAVADKLKGGTGPKPAEPVGVPRKI